MASKVDPIAYPAIRLHFSSCYEGMEGVIYDV